MNTLFQEGSLLSTKQRMFVIAQLCLSFTLIVWYLGQPFLGEYYSLRSQMLLYEFVMGKGSGNQIKMEQNAQRFELLPRDEQQMVKENYQKLHLYANRSIDRKIREAFFVFIYKIPLFEQAWIFFSITIAILLLLKKEGAKQAVWIIPIIVLAYAIDNQTAGKSSFYSLDESLFPSEKMIVEEYLDQPLSSNWREQKKQLQTGWKNYLIANWRPKNDQKGKNIFDEAEFQFTLFRLKLLQKWPQELNYHKKVEVVTLCCYLLWNGFFAWFLSSYLTPYRPTLRP